MQNDVLYDYDGIVDDQSAGSSQASQSHHVEALSQHFHGDESYKYGHGNHETRHECGAPVAKEKPDDESSEQKADDDRVAYTADRFPDNVRLVVKDFQINAGRKRRAKIVDFLVNF